MTYVMEVATAVLFGTVALAVARLGVKGVVLGLLRVYKQASLTWLRLRGLTPTDVVEARVVSGQSWEEFCDTLKAAGATVLAAGTPKDAFNQAEGYRYLSRIARAGLENFIECNSPQAPVLAPIVDGLRRCPIKLGSDNPDNLYESATIDGRMVYRLRGPRGTVNYLGLGVQAGQYGAPGGLSTVDYLEIEPEHLTPEGEVDIYIGSRSAKKRLIDSGSADAAAAAARWLHTVEDPTSGLIIVRQTFLDRESEVPARLVISRVGAETTPEPFSAAALDEGLKSTGLLVAGASMMFARWANGFQKHANKLPLFDQETSNKVGGDPNIRYYHSFWRLAPDEALVIEAKPPGCRHWNFQLNNYWMESLDYRYFPVWVNKHSANYDEKDGSICLVVTAKDPKLRRAYNWIDTTGHDCGTMCFRWIKPDVPDDQLPHPSTRVVKVSDLKGM